MLLLFNKIELFSHLKLCCLYLIMESISYALSYFNPWSYGTSDGELPQTMTEEQAKQKIKRNDIVPLGVDKAQLQTALKRLRTPPPIIPREKEKKPSILGEIEERFEGKNYKDVLTECSAKRVSRTGVKGAGLPDDYCEERTCYDSLSAGEYY